MATNTQNFSTDLKLPLLPSLENVPPRAYEEFIKLYSALRNLAQAVDNYAGTGELTQEQRAELIVENQESTITLQNYCYIYARFAEDCTYGQLVRFNTSSDLVVKAVAGQFNVVIFFVLDEEVKAGEIGKICFRGLLRINGVTPGNLYYMSTTPGGVTSSFIADVTPVIGIGVTTESILFFRSPRAKDSLF